MGPTMIKVFCKDCIFWDITHAGTLTKAREGRCRRHAPTPMSENLEQEAGTIWPATFDDDWCGEGKMHGDDVSDELLVDITPAPRPKNNTPPKREL